MIPAARRRAFVLAALLVAFVATLGPLCSPPTKEPAPAQRTAAERPGAYDAPVSPKPRPALPPRGTDPPNPPGAERVLRAAERQTRRFVAAFLAYQDGSVDARTRRTLTTTAAPRVARRLLDRPPRDLGARGRARVLRVELHGPWGGRAKATALLAYPAQRERSLLELALRRRDGDWRITDLYP
jgi:hypothetical protein